MTCDTYLRQGQTIQQRAAEIRDVVERFTKGLVSGVIKAIVSKDGAIAFSGVSDKDRNNVTDACVYRRVMATGSALAKAQIAKAEAMAGKTVSRQTIGHGGHGTHSHDGGKTWHHGH